MFKEQYPQDLSVIIPHIGLKPNPAQSDLLSPPTAKVLPEKIHVSVSNLVLPRFISFPFAQPYLSTEYNCTRKFDVQIWKAEAHRAYQSWGYMLQNVVWVLHTACEPRKKFVPNMKGVAAGCDSKLAGPAELIFLRRLTACQTTVQVCTLCRG